MAELFDPDSFYSRKRIEALEHVVKYVNTIFHSCFKKEARRALAKAHPLPDILALHCPRMDEVIRDFTGPYFPTGSENAMKRIQSSYISSAAPMLHL